MCRGVIELDGLYPSQIVVVSGKLGITDGGWEVGFRNEFVGLVVQVVVEVVPKKQVDEDGLALVIMS